MSQLGNFIVEQLLLFVAAEKSMCFLLRQRDEAESPHQAFPTRSASGGNVEEGGIVAEAPPPPPCVVACSSGHERCRACQRLLVRRA